MKTIEEHRIGIRSHIDALRAYLNAPCDKWKLEYADKMLKELFEKVVLER